MNVKRQELTANRSRRVSKQMKAQQRPEEEGGKGGGTYPVELLEEQTGEKGTTYVP